MLCAGAVRKKNVQNTMLKNLLDAVSITSGPPRSLIFCIALLCGFGISLVRGILCLLCLWLRICVWRRRQSQRIYRDDKFFLEGCGRPGVLDVSVRLQCCCGDDCGWYIGRTLSNGSILVLLSSPCWFCVSSRCPFNMEHPWVPERLAGRCSVWDRGCGLCWWVGGPHHWWNNGAVCNYDSWSSSWTFS